MESNNLLSLLRKEIEEKVNNIRIDGDYLLFISNGQNQAPNLVELLNLEGFENDLFTKYSTILHLTERNEEYENEPEIWSPFSAETNFEFPFENFPDLPTKSKLKALDELLNATIIDTKQENWSRLSEALVNCCKNSNNEIFLRSLKVHYRIICFSATACDGFISLLKCGLTVCSNSFNEYSAINCDTSCKGIRKITQMILATLKFVLRNVQHIKQKVIEEAILLFVSLLNQNFKSNGTANSFSKLIDLVCVLDKNATWFKLFSCASKIRDVFIDHLIQQKVLKLIVILYHHSSKIDNLNSKNNLKIFTHSCCCMKYFLQYSDNIKHFPIQIRFNEKVNYLDILEHMVLLIKDNHVNNEMKSVLTNSLFYIFFHNPHLLVNKVLLHLLEPFRFFEKKCPISILGNNLFVIDIVKHVSLQDKHVLFANLNKYHKPKHNTLHKVHSGCMSYRGHINYPQIVIDFTIALLKKVLNDTDNHIPLNQNILKLLDCCKNIFESNSVSLYYVNSKKLILTLKAVYESYSQRKIFLSKEVTNLFVWFFENTPHVFESINDDHTSQRIIEYIFMVANKKSLTGFICSISSNPIGCKLIQSHHNSLIRNQLEKLWYLNKNCSSNIKKSYDPYDDFIMQLNEFLHTIFIFTATCKVISSLLNYEDEDTVTDTHNEKSISLEELIEKSLTSSSNTVEEYVGLLLIKILISNVDICLYLETNYKIQDRLSEIQDKCLLESIEDNDEYTPQYITDSCGYLRQNILITVKHFGFVSHNIDRDFLQQTTIPNDSVSPSSALRRGKSPNELKKFLDTAESDLHDQTWMLHARRAFKLICGDQYKVSVIAELLDLVPKTFVYRKRTLSWPPVDSVYHQLFPEDLMGTTMIVNYGIKLGLLSSTEKNENNLNMLIKQTRNFLSHYPEQFENYDWFLGVTFLSCFGNVDKCRQVLINTANTNITSLIWYTFGKEFDFILQDNFYIQLRIIIEENNPIAYQALENAKIPLNLLVQKWLSQCFFNILEFQEICNFIIFIVLFPPEAILFYILAIFEHIKEVLCTLSYSKTPGNALQVTRLETFRLSDYMPFIEKYLKQYKNVIKL